MPRSALDRCIKRPLECRPAVFEVGRHAVCDLAHEEAVHDAILSPEEPSHRIWMAMGRMIFHFAEMEGRLFDYLCELSGTPDAKAIFMGDARIEKARTQIARIHKSRGMKLNKTTERYFGQIKSISTLRNDLVHRSVNFAEDIRELIIDDSRWTLEEPKRYKVTENIINDAGRDLQMIKNYLVIIRGKIMMPDFDPSEIMSLPNYEQYSWLYKSPQPIRAPSSPPPIAE